MFCRGIHSMSRTQYTVISSAAGRKERCKVIKKWFHETLSDQLLTQNIRIEVTVNMQNIYSGLETANKKPQPCMAKCSCFPSEVTAAKLIKPEVKGVSGAFMCVLYLLCVCQSSGFTFLEQSPFLTS